MTRQERFAERFRRQSELTEARQKQHKKQEESEAEPSERFAEAGEAKLEQKYPSLPAVFARGVARRRVT